MAPLLYTAFFAESQFFNGKDDSYSYLGETIAKFQVLLCYQKDFPLSCSHLFGNLTLKFKHLHLQLYTLKHKGSIYFHLREN